MFHIIRPDRKNKAKDKNQYTAEDSKLNIRYTAEKANQYARKINAYEVKGKAKDDKESAIIDKLNEEIQEFDIACTLSYEANLFGFLHDTPGLGFKLAFEKNVKDTREDELADIIITALAASVEMGIDIEKHIDLKMRYNEKRAK